MGYIFEAEIDAIIHSVRIKTIGEEDEITLKKTLNAKIHPAIKAYFKAEVEKMLELERGLEYRSKKFPYSLPEVKSLERQIDLLLIQNYHFNKQEFETLLDESVHFQFNYLCRPQWTLMNFIIGEQRRISTSVIEKRLKYTVDYAYFSELIKRYIIEHGLAEITYEEFKSIIEKIDCEVIAQHSNIELANMTRALFDFVESGKMTPQTEFEQQTLPINAAIVFFEDKKLDDIRLRLEFERDRNRVLQLTAERLAEIIEIVKTEREVLESESTSKQPIIMEENKPINKDELIFETAEVDVKTNMISKSAEENLVVKEVFNQDEKAPKLVFGEDDEKYFISAQGISQKEIQGLFSNSERKILVKKIFYDEEPALDAIITEISLQQNWKQAAVILDTLFVTNKVDPFSEVAVLFTDKLFTLFKNINKS